MRRTRRAGTRGRAERGYVLILVLGAIALTALLATRFAQRIDALRAQTATLKSYAEQRLQTRNALAVALYWVSTRPIGPAGFGPMLEPSLRADDRVYRLPGGGEIQVQDERGLYPLNAMERESMRALLRAQNVAVQEADAYIDILLDYTDTDSLKRLNGAEAQDYAALGLPPPRNDWLISVRELNRMPRWRDSPAVVAAFERLASPGRRQVVNPNTAPIELLTALLPGARTEQLELFATLRRQAPFLSGAVARQATGLALESDALVFHVDAMLRITVSAAGAPMTHQYNLMLAPAGRLAPWQILAAHTAPRPERRESLYPDATLPLALPAAAPP